MQSLFDSFSDATLRRLFKFVLKRSLGRFLRDELVLEQVTVSSRNGLISIVDLELDPAAINEEFFINSAFQLRRCTIKRLESSISYSSLLKDGFKTSLHGVEVEVEPNDSNIEGNTAANSNRESQSPKAGSSSSSKQGQEVGGIPEDSSGIGYLVEWVEVLVLSIQASVFDVKVSIVPRDPLLHICVVNIAAVQYVNAGNSQVEYETSLSEASKSVFMHQSSDTASKSILDERLLKTLRLSGVTVSLQARTSSASSSSDEDTTANFTIFTFKRQVKVQWEAASYDKATSLADCSVSSDEADVTLCRSRLQEVINFTTGLQLPVSETRHGLKRLQSDIPDSTMKGLTWLEHLTDASGADGVAAGQIDFTRLSELTALYVSKRTQLGASTASRPSEAFGIESEYFDAVEGPGATRENNSLSPVGPAHELITELQVRIKRINISFSGIAESDSLTGSQATGTDLNSSNHERSSSIPCLHLVCESLLLASAIKKSAEEELARDLQFTIGSCQLIEKSAESDPEGTTLVSFSANETSRSIIPKPHISISVTRTIESADSPSDTLISMTLEPICLSAYSDRWQVWSRLFNEISLPSPTADPDDAQSKITVSVNCPKIDLFLHAQVTGDALNDFIDMNGCQYFDKLSEEKVVVSSRFRDHYRAHDSGMHLQLTSLVMDIPNFTEPMHMNVAASYAQVGLFATNNQLDFRERVVARSHLDYASSSSPTPCVRLEIRPPNEQSVSEEALENSLFPVINENYNLLLHTASVYGALDSIDYRFLRLIVASLSSPVITPTESSSESLTIKPTASSFALRADTCLVTLNPLESLTSAKGYSLVCKNVFTVFSNLSSSVVDQWSLLKWTAQHARLLESSGRMSASDATSILAGQVPDTLATIAMSQREGQSPDGGSVVDPSFSLEVLTEQFTSMAPPRVTVHVDLFNVNHYFDPESNWLQNLPTLLGSFFKSKAGVETDGIELSSVVRLQLNCQEVGIIDCLTSDGTQTSLCISRMTVSSNLTSLSDVISIKFFVTSLELRIALISSQTLQRLHTTRECGVVVLTVESLSCLLVLNGYESSSSTESKRTQATVELRSVFVDVHRDSLLVFTAYMRKLSGKRTATPASIPQVTDNTERLEARQPTSTPTSMRQPKANWLDSLSTESFKPLAPLKIEDPPVDEGGLFLDVETSMIENFYGMDGATRAADSRDMEGALSSGDNVAYWVPAFDESDCGSVVSNTESAVEADYADGDELSDAYSDDIDKDEYHDPILGQSLDQTEFELNSLRLEITPASATLAELTADSPVVDNSSAPKLISSDALPIREEPLKEEAAAWLLNPDQIDVRNTHIRLPGSGEKAVGDGSDSGNQESLFATECTVRANIRVKFSNSLLWPPSSGAEVDDFLLVEQSVTNTVPRLNGVIEVVMTGVVFKHFEGRLSGSNKTGESNVSDNSNDNATVAKTSFLVYDGMITFEKEGHRKRKVVGALKSLTIPRDISVPFIKIVSKQVHGSADTSHEQGRLEHRLRVAIIPLRVFVDDEFISTCGEWLKETARAADNSSPSTESVDSSSASASASPTLYLQKVDMAMLKVKLSYKSSKLDLGLLSKGDYSQLLSVFPIDGAVLQLKPISVNGITGLPKLFKLLIDSYIKDVCKNQLSEILSGTAPLKGTVNIGQQLQKLVLIPLKKSNANRSVARELQRSSASVLNAIAKEALDLSHQIAKFASETIRDFTNDDTGMADRISNSEFDAQPRGVSEGLRRAAMSIRREMSQTSDILIALPMQQYQSRGAGGVVKTVLKSLPIAIMHTSTGVAEAVSFSLLGLRNKVSPAMRHEDEDIYDIAGHP